jgi:hypothetical protein
MAISARWTEKAALSGGAIPWNQKAFLIAGSGSTQEPKDLPNAGL